MDQLILIKHTHCTYISWDVAKDGRGGSGRALPALGAGSPLQADEYPLALRLRRAREAALALRATRSQGVSPFNFNSLYTILGPRITILFQSFGRNCVITGKTGHFSAYWRNDQIFRSKLKFGDNDPSWRGAGM